MNSLEKSSHENSLDRLVRNSLAGLLQPVLLSAFAILLASLVLLILDYDAFAIVKGIYKSLVDDFGDTLRWSIPLIFTGLAVAVAFRAGSWNLGVDGQLYLGAMASTILGLKVSYLPFPISIFAALFAGAIAGALWAGIAALLRVFWNTNEVVTTLFLNFIAFLFTDFLILGPLKGIGIAAGTFSTNKIPEHYWLARIFHPSQANIGLFIALAMTLFVGFIFYRSTLGYEFKLVRQNSRFARYGGVSVRKVIWTSMLISGAIAGLAGAVEILGAHHRFPGRFSHGLGFDGIVVALLAKNNPFGVLFSGLFLGALRNGAMNMERITDVPRAVVEIVQSIIILMVSARFGLDIWRKRRRQSEHSVTSGRAMSEGKGE
jgi:simple sugar transport system permease protein